MLRGLKQTLCAPGPRDPTETETELCLGVSCGGMGQQWAAAGAGALGQQPWIWHKPSWRRSPLIPPQSQQNLHRTEETDSWKAQTKPCAHQDPATPKQTNPDLPVSVQESPAEAWVSSSAGMGPFEGGHHYLHYLHDLHHSLASGQITGREHSPAH